MNTKILKYIVAGSGLISLAAQCYGHELPVAMIGYAADTVTFATGVAMLAYQWESGDPKPETTPEVPPHA